MKKLYERNGDIQVKSTTSKEKAEGKERECPACGQTRKLSAWKNVNKQVLELKCNEHKIVAKGTQKQLAERLFKHFQAIRNNEILAQDATQLDNTVQETEETGPSLPTSGHENINVNEAESREQQNAGPSVAELASSVQNLTEIVMGLTKAQGHSGSGECSKAKRKRTHSPASSSSSPETSDASDSDSPVSVSSNDNNSGHPRSKSASVNKASRARCEENTVAVGGDNITVHRVHRFPKRQLPCTIQDYLTRLHVKMAAIQTHMCMI